VTVRDAQPEDWDAIWPTFRRVCQAGETYTYPLDPSYEEGRALWYDGRVVVAFDPSGRVVGTAHMGPNRDGNGAHIATGSFMVDPSYAGRGVGRALGEDLVAWARRSGFRGIQFNAVVEVNAAAVHLWRSMGFQVVGTVPGAFCHPRAGYVGLHVMFLDLT
jgi:GNAT superfamily N-acetyltransferase